MNLRKSRILASVDRRSLSREKSQLGHLAGSFSLPVKGIEILV
jgi:hypothetical protein